MESNKKNQELILQEKSRILSEIEEKDKEIEKEEKANLQRMDEWKSELTQQIYEKRKQKEKEMLESLDMLTRMKFEEDQEKFFVDSEESRMKMEGYKPKVRNTELLNITRLSLSVYIIYNDIPPSQFLYDI